MIGAYESQQQLLEVLSRAWNYNAEILRRHGYVVTKMGAPPVTQDIAEPDAQEAQRVIGAVSEVWRSLFTDDKAAIANAGLWLGIVSSGQYFRKRQAGNRQGKNVSSARDFAIGCTAWDELRKHPGRRPTWKAFDTEFLKIDPDSKPSATRRAFTAVKKLKG
ncbi:hypothetical protein [Thiocystis violacea]|uniref:hypothetical protein n=1 Tax=Thiocystis violacea TaxID=13725 RepID=UPI00190644FB|nr:hypothetical protein [Thiocystis violacea]MBK1723379.1 hypothetical protein [Thiocystis violacea]